MTISHPRYRRARQIWAAAVLLLMTMAVPRPGWCQTTEPALGDKPASTETGKAVKELIRKGLSEYRANNLEAARDAFQKAWELTPHTDIAANLAEIEMKLGRYRDAAEHWEYYLKHRPPDREEAEAYLDECRKHLARIRISVDETRAVVFVDGRPIGVAPFNSDVWLEPGAHAVAARFDGRTSPEHQIAVAAGETRAVSLALAPAAREPPDARPPPPRPQPRAPIAMTPHDGGRAGTRNVVLIGGSALTLVAVGVGIAFLARGNATNTAITRLQTEAKAQSAPQLVRRNQYCTPRDAPSKCAELDAKVDERSASYNVAIGSFVAAGVFGLATLGTYLLWQPGRRTGDHASNTAAPTVVPERRGLSIRIPF